MIKEEDFTPYYENYIIVYGYNLHELRDLLDKNIEIKESEATIYS